MNKINTRKALNPAYRKHKPLRREVNHFIMQLQNCIHKVKLSDDNGESEEHIKAHFRTFFKNTFYKDNYINTKDRIDLAIYLENNAKSNVAVLIEAKKPSNKAEFLELDNLNKKALQELLLYYLRERIDNGNNNIKHLIATNGYEWYLFKSEDFYNYFYKNKELLKEYNDFKNDLKDTSKTELFYNEIAKKYIGEVKKELPFVHLDFTKTNLGKLNDTDLNTYYKIFSNVHILGHAFGNDSNLLNKAFYNELLHIIGLEEVKDSGSGKKIINRKAEKNRDYGSFLENTIVKLDYDNSEKAFDTGLELCLTWVNRILFLKLLESQLVSYQKSDTYKFLNIAFITDFDKLNDLFFFALAKKENERHPKYKEKYKNIPYLNSSLFEKSTLETKAFGVSSLDNDKMAIYNGTVLKETNGKKQTGKLSTLKYLFQFLEAYDFATDGSEDIEENHETKTLINASVLGLIFEKINGYKEGSFYTPAYITMYMCRETIRKAVIQKFNETKNWNCTDLNSLYNKIKNTQEANDIFNSIKICDPAVGSGHFLVSALNELIVIKHDLKILQDGNGRLLKKYQFEVVNDELIVTDEDGELFEYNPKSKESQRIQKALFHEKQTLIENCLFGVDINPNSVKICRLRLWIELLKNAYYKNEKELETLPNIDINIKCGNSLISRFKLNGSYLELSPKTQQAIIQATKKYKDQVILYKCTDNKEVKKQVRNEIERLKKQFSQIANPNDKEYIEIKKIEGELGLLPTILFNKKDKDEYNKKVYRLGGELNKLKKIYDEKLETIYRNAFEWRFEFPEVLNDKGGFMGFDVIIGNPPYIKEYEGKEIFDGLRENEIYQGKMDIWYLFACNGIKLLKEKGILNFIASNNWITNFGAKKMRNFMLKNTKFLSLVNFGSYMVFDAASIQTMVMQFQKEKTDNYTFDYKKIIAPKPILKDALDTLKKVKNDNTEVLKPKILIENYINKGLTFNSVDNETILNKLIGKSNFKLNEKEEVAQGVVFPQDFVNKYSNTKLKKSTEILYLQDKEIANGIHPHHDFVNKRIASKSENKFKVGDGIFGLSEEENENLNFTKKEKKLIKPYYTSKQFSRYYANRKNKLWLIYTSSKFKDPKEIELYPNIKRHLDQFKNVITSDNKPYGLHRARNEKFFIGEKIIVQRKCPKKPIFTYTDFNTYVSATFYVIKTDRLNLKYLTGLLNSKLIEFWLKNKGKMQGANFQIDKDPLLNIPLVKVSKTAQKPFIKLVETILSKKAKGESTEVEEKEIDRLVYVVYGLSLTEIKIIENR